MKAFNLSLVAGLSAVALSACSSQAPETTADDTTVVAEESMAPDAGMTAPTAQQNIVTMAQGNPDVSTLVSAISAAGLAETLSGPGPFTVFAPTNDAFAKVNKATLDGLMKPEAKEELASLLKYHVVSGNVKAADVIKMIADGKGSATIKTLGGGSLKASLEGQNVVLTDAKGSKATVTNTDMTATNGTVHTVNSVLMP